MFTQPEMHDVTGLVFAFLDITEQAALRVTSREFRSRFNTAVYHQRYISFAASEAFTDEISRDVDWAPISASLCCESTRSMSDMGFGTLECPLQFRTIAATIVENGPLHSSKPIDGMLACCLAESLIFSASDVASSIGGAFLYACKPLKNVRFYNCASIRSIGNSWLASSERLATISFQGAFPALEKVGNGWLQNSRSLATIHFSGLDNLVSIGDSWLEGCKELRHFKIDATMFPRLATIGDKWFRECCFLRDVEVHGMPSLVSIGERWMLKCPWVRRIALSGFPRLSSIGWGCLGRERDLDELLNDGLVVELEGFPRLDDKTYVQCKEPVRFLKQFSAEFPDEWQSGYHRPYYGSSDDDDDLGFSLF